MWVSIQATVTCSACGARTAANAAITGLLCDACGADLSLLPEFWRSVLASAGDSAVELDQNAATSLSFDQVGTKIRLRITRTGARCPHCESAWPEVAPGDGFACPACGEDVGVRRPPGGATDAVARLVAEDRALLAGDVRDDVVAESLHCPSCGGPVRVDGTRRHLACGACSSEVLVPDEVWRRVHAPSAVATWYLWSPVRGTTGITQDLSIQKLCVGADGRLFALGTQDFDDVMMALDTDPLRLVWTRPTPLDADFDVLALVGDELWLCGLRSPTIRRIDPATGEERGSLDVPETDGLQAVVDMGDGTAVVQAYPSERLERIATTGDLRPLWPASSLFGRLFGGDRGGQAFDRPLARPGVVNQGRFGRAWSGGMCLATTFGGSTLARLDGSGGLAWTVKLPDAVMIQGGPQASPDGAVFVLTMNTDGGRLTRISADGREIRELQSESFEGGDERAKGVSLVRATLAVGPDGDVWLAGSDGVERYDGQGKLRWHWYAE